MLSADVAVQPASDDSANDSGDDDDENLVILDPVDDYIPIVTSILPQSYVQLWDPPSNEMKPWLNPNTDLIDPPSESLDKVGGGNGGGKWL